ncbi:hypothetical protein BJF79_43895 [Actinomadura sp. CNU-125]|nr:hypothetical protein BJF79_43895 [Actinomadura sp. CNU-125]
MTTLALINPGEAERVARTITAPQCQAEALVEVADALWEAEPLRARVLLADAERVSQAIGPHEGFLRGRILVRAAELLARMDPGDAERLARATNKPTVCRVEALTKVAGVLVEADAGRARMLFADAETIARTLDHEQERALAWIAGGMARLDADEAERLARTIPDPYAQGRALREVTRALTERDVDTAERLARTITDPLRQAQALEVTAAALATAAPQRARKMLTDAERLARTIHQPWYRARTLVRVADTLAEVDPEQARRLIADAERFLSTEHHSSPVLEDAAKMLTKVDPREAERLAQAIPEPRHRAKALKKVAEEVARTDPNDAERIAHTIAPGRSRIQTLVGIAVARALAVHVHRPVEGEDERSV